MNKVTHIDLEVSSTCQASCSACARNSSGVTVINPANLSLADVQRSYKSLSKDLKTITLCGNVGDSMGNKDIALICRWFIMRNPNILITVHTNGGLGAASTYRELAMLGVKMVFGIDGLEDTNHFYRTGVSWKNIVKNLKAYQSGFENKIKVRWTRQYNDDDNEGEYRLGMIQMIVWEHNQHQILDMARFAQENRCSIWYRKANISKDDRVGNRMPVFTGTGKWLCNISEPDEIIEPLCADSFPCPAIDHPDNNLDTQVTKFMDQVCRSRKINIHKWRRLLEAPIPPDTKHTPADIDQWHETVPIKWHEPNKEKGYRVKIPESELKRLSTSVACKSFNFDNPGDIHNTDAEKEVFVGADGYITPCCMIGSALTLHLQNVLETDDSPIGIIKKDLINRIIDIGVEKFNSHKHTLEEILESGALDDLVWTNMGENDTSKGRVPFCSLHCGSFNSYGRPSRNDRDSG